MNKLSVLIPAVLFLSSSILFGQVNLFNVGIEGGPGLKNLYGNEHVEKGNALSIGFSGGVTFQYNFTELVSLRSNISYERKGLTRIHEVRNAMGIPLGESTIHFKYDYLTIPLLARFTFGDKIGFFVNAGPYAGYLIKSNEIFEAFQENPRIKVDNTDYHEKLDFGLTTGLGLIYPWREKTLLSVEIRNSLGLTNISARDMLNDGSLQTNTFQSITWSCI